MLPPKIFTRSVMANYRAVLSSSLHLAIDHCMSEQAALADRHQGSFKRFPFQVIFQSRSVAIYSRHCVSPAVHDSAGSEVQPTLCPESMERLGHLLRESAHTVFLLKGVSAWHAQSPSPGGVKYKHRHLHRRLGHFVTDLLRLAVQCRTESAPRRCACTSSVGTWYSHSTVCKACSPGMLVPPQDVLSTNCSSEVAGPSRQRLQFQFLPTSTDLRQPKRQHSHGHFIEEYPTSVSASHSILPNKIMNGVTVRELASRRMGRC